MTAFEDAINATSTPWAPWYDDPGGPEVSYAGGGLDIITTTIKAWTCSIRRCRRRSGAARPMRRRRCSPSGSSSDFRPTVQQAGAHYRVFPRFCQQRRPARGRVPSGTVLSRARTVTEGFCGEGDLERCMVDNSRSQRDEGVDAVGPEPWARAKDCAACSCRCRRSAHVAGPGRHGLVRTRRAQPRRCRR